MLRPFQNKEKPGLEEKVGRRHMINKLSVHGEKKGQV